MLYSIITACVIIIRTFGTIIIIHNYISHNHYEYMITIKCICIITHNMMICTVSKYYSSTNSHNIICAYIITILYLHVLYQFVSYIITTLYLHVLYQFVSYIISILYLHVLYQFVSYIITILYLHVLYQFVS